MNTRSVTSTHTASVLRVLHKDFPSDDTTVRLVLLLTVFLSDSSHLPENFLPTPATSQLFERYVETCSDEIEDMDLGPLTRKDIIDILLSKFVPERFGGILEYARSVLDLDKEAMRSVVTEVALGCLEIGCKGKMLAKLVAAYPYLSDVIATHIVKTYRIQLEDLPPVEDEKACKEYAAPLCADLLLARRRHRHPQPLHLPLRNGRQRQLLLLLGLLQRRHARPTCPPPKRGKEARARARASRVPGWS